MTTRDIQLLGNIYDKHRLMAFKLNGLSLTSTSELEESAFQIIRAVDFR